MLNVTGKVMLNSIRVNLNLVKNVRNLYSASSLGIDLFLRAKENFREQFSSTAENFKDKIKSSIEQGKTVFTEDLKQMIYITEPEDLSLVESMMIRFASQNKELRFGSFIFGPVVMRMYYDLNKPKEAFEMFKNESMDGFFDQLITYQIVMDLLWNNEMYEEALEAFEIIKSRQLRGQKYPKNVVVLAFAACYKLNTPESFEIAKNLWIDLNKTGHYPMRRACTFAAALAIKQNNPTIALEILSTQRTQNYVTIRNLKVSALCDVGRVEDTLAILRGVLEIDHGNNLKHTFFIDVMEKVNKSIDSLDKPDVKAEFDRIVKQLKVLDFINDEVDTQLCSTIDGPTRTNQPFNNQRDDNFNFKNRRQFKPQAHPGLRDMV